MRLRTICCCLLLLVAGCQGPAQSGPSTTATPDGATQTASTTTKATTTAPTTDQTTTERRPEISVTGGTLPYDPVTVWTRVKSLLAADVAPPGTITITNLSGNVGGEPTRFQRLLGVPAPSTERGSLAGRALPPGNEVQLNDAALDAEDGYETVLAHEYVHVVQMRTRARGRVWSQLDETYDGRVVYSATIEGAATYADNQYTRKYTTLDPQNFRAAYRNATSSARFGLAPYYFGARYVNATVDSAAAIYAIYENPPRTSEELIHVRDPGSEPRADLSVSTETGRETTVQPRFGELYVRALLGTALDESVAADAAEGWGNDRRVVFGSDERADYAWVLRWDDATNATEFADAVAAYEDARSGVDTNVRVEQVAPETTVVFVGTESFVADAAASGSNSTVTVTA
jgi:hypothetical protein